MEAARQAAEIGGAILLNRFDGVKEVSFKGRGNIVTDVDTEVEAAIFASLGRESKGASPESGPVWIVDPLDGTRNYASGIPFFAVVVGLALDGEVLVGVTYDPVRDEMFHAERGRGALLNGEPIRVSSRTSISDCIVGMDLSYSNDGAVNGLNVIRSIWPGMQTARVMGSAALGIAYAAAGRTDLYFHHQLEPWDQVTGILLVEEAGGVVTDRTGQRARLYSDGLVASNSSLHADFMRLTNGMPWRRPTRRLA